MVNNIRKCELAKDRLAEVYSSEAKDEVYDNGLLDSLNFGIRFVEDAINELKTRVKE